MSLLVLSSLLRRRLTKISHQLWHHSFLLGISFLLQLRLVDLVELSNVSLCVFICFSPCQQFCIMNCLRSYGCYHIMKLRVISMIPPMCHSCRPKGRPLGIQRSKM